MEWMGLITLTIIYWCFITALVTGVWSWAFLTVWCFPVLALAVSYQQGMEINGLMVVLCALMFMGCRRGLLELRMWNVKMRKRYGVLFGLLFFFCLLFLYYSYWQAQALGYLWDLQGIKLAQADYFRMIAGTIPLCLVSWPLTEMLYNGLDRVLKKDRELVLLNCKFFLADAKGGDRGFFKGHYLDGIHNGVNYHFRLTRRTFEMLKKEKNLRLRVRVGLLNGLYVVENPCPENAKKTRRRDRRHMQAAFAGFVVVLAFGIWYFWFF